MRLDKFLSHAGFGSRKEVKSLLKKKIVSVAGVIVTEGKYNFDEKLAVVMVADEPIIYEKERYFILNKPQGVISATEDRVHRTVVDLLAADDFHQDIFPVGRLDKDTTGLLILTTDGKFAHNLLSPKKHVPKTYRALVSGVVTEEDQELFKKGIMISGEELCLPATTNIIAIDKVANQTDIEITISEGKYHQVKRMFEAVGKQVLELQRTRMGDLLLDKNLAAGEYRKLAQFEIDDLKNYYQKNKSLSDR